MAKVLIVGPHPDDAEIGMGGAILKMVARGWGVVIVDLTDGEPTPFGSRAVRKAEAAMATEVLGVSKRLQMEMPNRQLAASMRNRIKLAEVIRTERPDMIFGPVLPDFHPDHLAASELCEGARFHAKLTKTVIEGECHWVGKKFGYYSPHRSRYEKANLLVDVSGEWERKMAAIGCYESQLKASEGRAVSLVERVEAVGRYFGAMAGVRYAEPFTAGEFVRVSDIGLLET